MLLDGKRVLLLCSNNYLGLADHPRVREAAADAAMRYGVGAGASRLVSGNMTLHRRLEERLAEFKGTERCVLFGSGYLANVGVIAALAREGDVVFSDALNHASIIDGCRLARAETFVYDHLDTEHLEWGLREAGGRGSLIVTDGVFSMDGDVAPLERDRRARAPLRRARDGRRGARDRRARPGRPRQRGGRRPRGRGRRDRRHARQGARRLRRLRLLRRRDGELPREHRAHADLLDRAAAARRSRRRWRRSSCCASSPRRVERLRRNARGAARRARPSRASRSAGGETQIVPLVLGDADAGRRRLRARAAARRVRAGDPAADGARRAARGCGSRRWRPTRRPSCDGPRQQLARGRARGGRRPGTRSADARELFVYDAELDEPALQRAA